MSGAFFTGCAVWGHGPWVGGLYPSGTPNRAFLETYAQRLTAVEGNTTFHVLPAPDTVAKWARTLPPRFRFLPKLHRDISHEGRLTGKTVLAGRFRDLMEPLRPNWGPFFLQLPPRYGPRLLPDLAEFLSRWPGTVPLAVEVRALDWFRAETLGQLDALLERLGMARVLLDTRPCYEAPDAPMELTTNVKPDLPVAAQVTAPFTMVRYIGHPRLDRNERYLSTWAERVHEWLDAGTDVYFMVHCPVEDHSPNMVRLFQELLEARGAPVPPLPWDSAPGQLPLL